MLLGPSVLLDDMMWFYYEDNFTVFICLYFQKEIVIKWMNETIINAFISLSPHLPYPQSNFWKKYLFLLTSFIDSFHLCISASLCIMPGD